MKFVICSGYSWENNSYLNGKMRILDGNKIGRDKVLFSFE